MSKSMELNIDESMIDTVLAKDIDFTGTLQFSKSLMIKGKFDGDIDATGHLIIGPGAVVAATIKAGVITNYGTINGNVTAIEKLEMFNNATLSGDVNTPELIIESGCKYNGSCRMDEKKVTSNQSDTTPAQNQNQNQEQRKQQ